MNEEVSYASRRRRTFLLAAGTAAVACVVPSPAQAATDPVLKDELVVNVLDHGAKRLTGPEPVPNAGDYTLNDAAFEAAWNQVRDVGGRIYIPAGYYPINKWVIRSSVGIPKDDSARRTVRVHVDAPGAVLLVNPVNASGIADDSAVVNFIADDSAASSNLIRKVRISGLAIQADAKPVDLPNWQWKRPRRSGFYFQNLQELQLDNCWVSYMEGSGLVLDGVMDSGINDIQIMYCGRAGDPGTPDSANAYAVRVFTGADTNANALRFIGLHVEFSPLMLLVDGPAGYASRHIEFIGCKFERGSGIASNSDRSPVHLGNVRELSFTSCMFVQNNYRVPPGKEHPPFLRVVEQSYDANTIHLPKRSVAVTNCHFTTPDDLGERWFAGGNTRFVNCDFARCASDANQPDWAVFDLHDSVSLTDCSFTFASAVAMGESDGTISLRNDFVRFLGKNSAVTNPTIYFPAGRVIAGMLITVKQGAVSNSFTGFRDVFRLIAEGSDVPLPQQVRYQPSGPRNLGTAVIAEAIYRSITKQLPPGEPTVFGVESGTLMTSKNGVPTPYTDFRDGYEGQVLHLYTGWGQNDVKITHNDEKIITSTKQTLVLPEKTLVSFVQLGGIWRQT